ncbi:DUF5000 domain-containing lipoprotein [Arcticibacter sp.]|jgi:hypothetical protein|uniref:DUF5000 domain-containing lipoprotein n=1 Tax=Arcticibacter sp. TaxID=1872630 RepID=UPI00389009AD
MKIINRHLYGLLFKFWILSLIASCKSDDGLNMPASTDMTKPGQISNVKIENFNGGSNIIYDLPNSENILYVVAKYNIRDGVSRETKASYYSDTIRVEGFANSGPAEVVLYTVTRAMVMSDPLKVTVNPEMPVYQNVARTFVLEPDFGGVHIKAENPDKKEIGIMLTSFNNATQEVEVYDQYYSKSENISYSVRGFDTTPRNFGVYVTDKYGNISDTLKATISPLLEIMLNKERFSPFTLPSDTPIYPAWSVNHLWDGQTVASSTGWHTQFGNEGPYSCTFGIGGEHKLSRFILYARPDQYAFSHGNPKVFSLWGSNLASPHDVKLPLSAPEGTVLGDWVNMGNFRFPDPPSGLSPGTTNAADNAFIKAGVEFIVPSDAPRARYLRLSVSQSWSGGDFAHVMELTFFGQAQ